METFLILVIVVVINGIGLHIMVKQTNRLERKIDRLEAGYNTMVERYWQLSDIIVAHMGKDE